MREKVLKLMSLFAAPFDQIVEARMNDFRRNFVEETPQGMTPEREAAIVAYGDALRAGCEKREDAFVAIYESKFTAEEVDQLIAIYENPVFQRDREIVPKLVEASSQWMQEALVGSALGRILDEIAQAWLAANTEGDVAVELPKQAEEWTPPEPPSAA